MGVAIVDVSRAFLTADMDEDVYMCLRGPLADLMVKTAPDIYRKYVYVGPKKVRSIFKVAESTLWMSQERSAILPQAVGGSRNKRFYSQSIRSMCSK
jgi:hypothetical protein